MKILFISNYNPFESSGGAEKNAKAMIQYIQKKDKNIEFIYCRTTDFSLEQGDSLDSDVFMFESFDGLSNKIVKELKDYKYFIFENSYGFSSDKLFGLKQRKNKLIEENIIYLDFYKNAAKVIMQSSFQEMIFRCNIGDGFNYLTLNGNFWSEKDIELLEDFKYKRSSFDLIENKGKDFYAILGGKNDLHNKIKGVKEAVDFCKKKGFDYDIIRPTSYYNYLEELSKYDNLVFLPTVPETFSRVYIEARYLGLNVISNNNIGAKYTPYEYKYLPRKIKSFNNLGSLKVLDCLKYGD